MSRIHREFHDVDYWDKLNPAEKEFLGRFFNETLQNTFSNDGKDHYGDPELTVDPEQQELYRESNHRREDVYGCAKAAMKPMGGRHKVDYALRLFSLDRVLKSYRDHDVTLGDVIGRDSPEDAIIEYIDSQREPDEEETDTEQ